MVYERLVLCLAVILCFYKEALFLLALHMAATDAKLVTHVSRSNTLVGAFLIDGSGTEKLI